jgi:GNAT superfamily N-acetyltransferase
MRQHDEGFIEIMKNKIMSIGKASMEDAEEILALQKLAYRSEAEIHNDYTIPPLHQTLGDIRTQFENHVFLKAQLDSQIVGSVRAIIKKDSCFIGRLIVEPTLQNKGIGQQLMNKIETIQDAPRYELFTGYKSEKNLYLYNKLGYREFRREIINDRLTLVFMEKFRSVN